jgi:hypothetical protein
MKRKWQPSLIPDSERRQGHALQGLKTFPDIRVGASYYLGFPLAPTHLRIVRSAEPSSHAWTAVLRSFSQPIDPGPLEIRLPSRSRSFL